MLKQHLLTVTLWTLLTNSRSMPMTEVEVCPPVQGLQGDEQLCISSSGYHFCTPDPAFVDETWSLLNPAPHEREKRTVSLVNGKIPRYKHPAEAIAAKGSNGGWIISLLDRGGHNPILRRPSPGTNAEKILYIIWSNGISRVDIESIMLLSTRYMLVDCPDEGTKTTYTLTSGARLCFNGNALWDGYWLIMVNAGEWIGKPGTTHIEIDNLCKSMGTCASIDGVGNCIGNPESMESIQAQIPLCHLPRGGATTTLADFSDEMYGATAIWKGDVAIDTEPIGPGSISHVPVRPALGGVLRVVPSDEMDKKQCERGCRPTRSSRRRRKRGTGWCLIVCFGVGPTGGWEDSFNDLNDKMINNMNVLSAYVRDSQAQIKIDEEITRNASYQNRLYLVSLASTINQTHVDLIKLDIQRVKDKVDNNAKLNVLIKEQNALKLDIVVQIVNQEHIREFIQTNQKTVINFVPTTQFRRMPNGCIRFNTTDPNIVGNETIIGGITIPPINTDRPPTVKPPGVAPIFTRSDGATASGGEIAIICLTVVCMILFLVTLCLCGRTYSLRKKTE